MEVIFTEILSDINTGDLLLVDGDSLQSDIISEVTESNISHAGVFKRDGEELYVSEMAKKKIAGGMGLVYTPFEEYLNSNKGLYIYYPLFDYSKKHTAMIMNDSVGRINYSIWNLFADFIKKYTGIWIGHNRNNKMVCSGWCGYLYNNLRSDIKDFSNWQELVPADFEKMPHLFNRYIYIKNKQLKHKSR